MLYDFEILDKKLDDWGYPKLKSESGFKIIRTDFANAYRSGQIEFRSDGIYLMSEGREWKGYMYMPTYKIGYYGHASRFHLVKCSVIEEFMNSGAFRTHYQWSNSNVNDIKDRDTHIMHNNQILQLCSRCREKIIGNIRNTEDFYATLDTEEIEELSSEVDIFGYDRKWQKISRAYKEKQDYICEECGIEIKDKADRRFLHTHHLNGDKTNNNEYNLQCLCVLCHSYGDVHHEENFSKKRMRNEVKTFINKYRNELINVGNEYLTRFESENIN